MKEENKKSKLKIIFISLYILLMILFLIIKVDSFISILVFLASIIFILIFQPFAKYSRKFYFNKKGIIYCVSIILIIGIGFLSSTHIPGEISNKGCKVGNIEIGDMTRTKSISCYNLKFYEEVRLLNRSFQELTDKDIIQRTGSLSEYYEDDIVNVIMRQMSYSMNSNNIRIFNVLCILLFIIIPIIAPLSKEKRRNNEKGIISK